MRDLAKDFDLSDQGLAKKCKRHNIPRPPQGYWLKKEQARKRLVKPLPPNNDPWLETIDFFPKPESLSQSIKAKSTLVDEELTAAMKFKFPEKVYRYHPAIAKCRNLGKKVSGDRYSRMVFGHGVVNPGLKVTPETFDRACQFLQGIINLFDVYGWKFKLDDHKACFTFNGNKVEYEVVERVTKKEIPEQNPYRGLDALLWQRQDYESTGILEFKIIKLYGENFKKHWIDSRDNPLEQQLVSIVQGFSRAFEAERLWKIQAEERSRQREKAEAERKERERLWKIENDRRKHLFDLSEKYHKAKAVRDFLEALANEEEKPEGMNEWLSWANAVVDEIDPLCRQEGIIDQHEKYAEPPKPYWP